MKPLPLVIIGTGFTAASLLYQLLQKGHKDPIHIIGTGHLGAGQAYGNDNPHYRLNVRADLQGLFPEPFDDFEKWAAATIDDPEAKTDEGLFYKRADFRLYIDQALAKIGADKKIIRYHQQAVDIARRSDHWQISLEDGCLIEASQLYLAIGNAPSRWPCDIDTSATIHKDKMIASAWGGAFYDKLMADTPDAIAIIGGGLTAYDCINALYHKGYKGRIEVMTPHAQLPPCQADWRHGVSAAPWPKALNAYHFLRHIRSQLPKAYDWTDAKWQERFEAVRLILPEGWARLSDKDKQKIMKRCGAFWSLARYRAGPQAVAAGKALIAEGRLVIHRTRIKALSHDGTDFHLMASSGTSFKAQAVMNATGTGMHPLCDRLIQNRLAIADCLGLVVKVNEQCQILDAQGTPWEGFYMVGPPTMADKGDIVGAFSTARQIASIL